LRGVILEIVEGPGHLTGGRSAVGEAANHAVDRGPADHRFGGGGVAFVVTARHGFRLFELAVYIVHRRRASTGSIFAARIEGYRPVAMSTDAPASGAEPAAHGGSMAVHCPYRGG
jgi:hypothetical protein